jgi:hypothetical protein
MFHTQDHHAKFKPDMIATKTFGYDLEQLLLVISPIAKSIKCLESSHSPVADIYLFWLAIMASLEDLIENDKLALSMPVIKRIRRLCNWRFVSTR